MKAPKIVLRCLGIPCICIVRIAFLTGPGPDFGGGGGETVGPPPGGYDMARKSKRRQKPRAHQDQALEELLKAGEAVLYGQVCWSMANRGTERPRVGDVITLEGEEADDGHTSETFRLTFESIENIERCQGMRTCGEAAALFAQQKNVEPAGDCLLGHRDAALEYMMYGIEPTEPCPRCGEIPSFSNPAMSLDFYSDGTVKGVDGHEYTSCPECGDELLELQGKNPVGWGWNIACLNCGWEVKQAERLDIDQYCELMEEIKSKSESITQLMELPGITIRTRVESICLQLRMLLELIVFSSLVSNKDVWQKSHKELQSSRDISRKLRELKRIHPNFYPRSVDLQRSTPGEEPVDRSERYLSEDKLIEVYGRLGNILHAENPLGKETNYRYFIDKVPGWISQIQNLLECQKVYLYHHPEEFYLIKMFGDADGDLMCIPFRTTAGGKTKCAWPDCVSSGARLYCEYIQKPWRECQLPEVEPDQTRGKSIADEFDALDDEC